MSDDFDCMVKFFRSVGISSSTSHRCARILVDPPLDIASPIKLAKKIMKDFNLRHQLGLDEFDVECIEEELQRKFPDFFKMNRMIIETKDSTIIKAVVKKEGMVEANKEQVAKESVSSSVNTGSSNSSSSSSNSTIMYTDIDSSSNRKRKSSEIKSTDSDKRKIMDSKSTSEDKNKKNDSNNGSNDNDNNSSNNSVYRKSIDHKITMSEKKNKTVSISSSSDSNNSSNSSSLVKIFVESDKTDQKNSKRRNSNGNDNNNSKATSQHESIELNNAHMSEALPSISRPSSSSQSKKVLSLISGMCTIKESELTCEGYNYIPDQIKLEGKAKRRRANFPSVGCKNFPISEGKYYFEVTVVEGKTQIGWADSNFTGSRNHGTCTGVGDDDFSWAINGINKMHKGIIFEASESTVKWDKGIIGCSITLKSGSCSMKFYSLPDTNYENYRVVIFDKFKFSGTLYPCASFDKTNAVRFNFGSAPFSMKVPEGFEPYEARIEELGGKVNSKLERDEIRSCDGKR
jgi:hypothetical protein